jgi:ATP-dependent DNA helicase RecG
MPRSIDARLDFLSPVSLIAGLGPKRAAALHASGIDTLGDVLYYFPCRYIDRSVITPISGLPEFIDQERTIIGAVVKTAVERGRNSRLRIKVADDTGSMDALWFHGVQFFRKILHTGMRVLCTGIVKQFGPEGENFSAGRVQMIHPMLEVIGKGKTVPDVAFLPRYSLTEAMNEAGLGQKTFFKAVSWVLDNIKHYPQTLPSSVESKKHFPTLAKCLREMHMPSDVQSIGSFRERICYEELYRLAVTLVLSKRKFRQPGRSMSSETMALKFRKTLSFSLTQQQEHAVSILHAESKSHFRMHRLLQGDVGCGKTVVAFMACLPALETGMQVAWLTPTEALGRQGYSLLSKWCAALGVSIDILTGSASRDNKKRVLDGCLRGTLRLVVGTHALLQSSVVFKKLGMIVIDEQHKFGVCQRLSLQEKDPAADFLLMSATPIPQTLAKTLYGDLDLVTIRGLPAGRVPVSTHRVSPQRRSDMEDFVRKEITMNGAQVFYVVPRIEPGDGETLGNVRSAKVVFATLSAGKFSGIPCGLIHGRIDEAECEKMMGEFKAGRIKVLVATTIIEVGIDAADATIIIIENAERLGLSQLHQLRGRVGRSSKKAYCFLLNEAAQGDPASERLDYFCRHHDGFEIAEKDLYLRGPGEVAGMRQSGHDELKTADILRDASVFHEILNDLELKISSEK